MNIKIGINHADLDYIANQFPYYRGIEMPEPHVDPIDYPKTVPLADGTVRRLGSQFQIWNWGFMSEAQYAVLEGYEGEVSIVTLSNDGSYDEYTGLLVLPDKQPERRSGRVLDVEVIIKNLLAVT